MKNPQNNIKKFLTSFGFFSLILVSNIGETHAKYSLKVRENLKKGISEKEINYADFKLIEVHSKNYRDIYLVDNTENKNPNVLISEIIIEGWEDHPEGRKLELAAYDSMSIKPGSIVNNQILKKDLDAIYLSGWFSGVKFKAEDGPLGVRLIVNVVPNPILREITINPSNAIIPRSFINQTFNKYYGTTLNLNELQQRINIIKKWYEEKGYSLARIKGPERILENGIVQLKIDEGIVSGIKIRFIGTDEKVRKGKTKEWVIRRELKTNPGIVFNRKTLESDIERLYATSLFNDVKVSLSPDEESSEKVVITLDISEQRTGSLTGGVGFSNAAGIFAQIGLKESNAFGRAWTTSLNLNFGDYSTTYNFSLFDPWIKGDKYRTALRTNVFLSRDYPQEFRSEKNGRLYAVNDQNSQSNDALSLVVLENVGGGFTFVRPLNGGDPFKETPWRVSAGMNFRKVRLIDSDGNLKPFATTKPTTAEPEEHICIGHAPNKDYCPTENVLVSVTSGAVRNKLNNTVNPTSGNILRFGTEQFISVGNTSPGFNRLRASYAWFIPTKFINLTKECKSENSDGTNCPQTIGFQFKTGTIIGELPPYESFCMGGASSVRGWGACDLAVSKSFAEASAEYRVPIWRMISGALFADAGSDLGSQKDVPGKPGELLNKSGSGYSLGGGIGVKTPVGPLRLDVATQDLSGKMRYTLGVGWKF